MRKVRKAVIPVGGYGTRFLPMSKSVPKEMLPVGGKPVVLHVVEECIASGITDIIFVVAHHKHSIETFFSPSEMLEDYYLKMGKTKEVEELRRIDTMANYSFVFTTPPNGNGGSILAARHLIKDEPFVLVWGDEFFEAPGKPRVQQCIEAYEKYGLPVIAAVHIPDPKKRQLYGMAELKNFKREKDIKQVVRIMEKPASGKEPSEYAAHGAYILTPDIFDAFATVGQHHPAEVFLTDLLNAMQMDGRFLARIIRRGTYLDCGVPDNYLLSQVEYALMHADTRKKYQSEIQALLKKYR